MAGSTIQKGIGAAFHVNAETKAMRGFFTDLRNAGIQTIDPLDAHITLVDCAETIVPVFSDRDQLALNNARANAGRYLATMPYYELTFSPGDHFLQPYGARVGIKIAEQDFLLGVRKYVGGIFKEMANIDLSNRDYEAHLSMGMKTRGLGAAVKRVRSARVPRNIHVDGHDVSERVYVEDPTRYRSTKPYNNRVLRAVS